MKNLISTISFDAIESLELDSSIKELVISRLKQIGLPSAKMEHFRYFPIVPILSKEYQSYKEPDYKIEVGDEIKIIDGVIKEAPEFVNLEKNRVEYISKTHYDPIYYISHLLTDNVIKIVVKEDMSLKIKNYFKHSNIFSTYRIVLEVKEGVKLSLDEEFFSEEIDSSLSFMGMDIILDKGAKLVYVKDQIQDEKSLSILSSSSILLKEDAKMDLFSFDFGSSRSLNIYNIDLSKRSELGLHHLLYTNKSGVRGNILEVNHNQEMAKTTQNARHILNDSSKAIFDAIIRVNEGGKYAQTHQNNRSILLQDGAYMISKPQLEIYIDELEASHGSTTGEIDEEQVFYLQSRGIKKEDAKKMLIYAFAKDLIEKVEDEEIQNRIIDKFDKVYSGGRV